MQQFHESNLYFSFPSNWSVIQFDKHRFYTYLSGYGLKGVDFMALDNRRQLLLIEVKNYKDRFADARELLQQPEDTVLLENLINKFEDSIQLIRVGSKYYQRKWWYRIAEKFIRPLLKKSLFFWTDSQQIVAEGKEVCLILFLELESSCSQQMAQTYRDNILKGLQDHFKEKNFQLKIFDLQSKKATFEVNPA